MNKEDKKWAEEVGKYFDDRLDSIDEKLHEISLQIAALEDSSRCVDHSEEIGQILELLSKK